MQNNVSKGDDAMLSIIVPTYNEETLIENTLRRIREGVKDFDHEIIVTDDGSTDGTVEKALPLADTVVRYNGELPKTIANNRNRGAAHAQGDIMVFVDSDVYLAEPKLFFSSVIKQFQDDPRLAAMTVSLRVSPEAETIADRLVLAFFDISFRLMNNVLGFGVAHGKCMCVRASAFRAIKGFNNSIVASEDSELFIRLSRTGRTFLDPTLRAYFSGRRAHAIGWTKLLWRWTLNGLGILFLHRSYSKDWKREAPASSS